MQTEDNRTLLERHVQTIIVAATMALLSWVLLSVLDIRDRLVKFEERVSHLQSAVQSGTDDRFRRSDWLREKERLDERFLDLRNTVIKSLDRIEKLEKQQERLHGASK